MSAERVVTAIANGVLTLTLNRPEKRNAMDRPMVDGLITGLETADVDADVRVVVIRGAGKDFCAGADLQELLDSVGNTPQENAAHAAHLGEVFVRMRQLPKPVVAAVHGRALAGGCGLASACDLIHAHADSVFGYPEVSRGFVPAMVMAMLRRAVGERVAFDLVATGRLLQAAEALAIGLVSRMSTAERFEQDVASLIQQLADSSPSALAFIKRQLYEIDGRSFTDAIALGAEVNALARATPDFERAVKQFFEK